MRFDADTCISGHGNIDNNKLSIENLKLHGCNKTAGPAGKNTDADDEAKRFHMAIV